MSRITNHFVIRTATHYPLFIILVIILVSSAFSDELSVPISKHDYIYLKFAEYDKVIAPGLRVLSKRSKQLVTKDLKPVDPGTVTYREAMPLLNSESVELFLVDFPEKNVRTSIWEKTFNKSRFPESGLFAEELIKIKNVWCIGESIWIHYYYTESSNFVDMVSPVDGKYTVISTSPLRDSSLKGTRSFKTGFFFFIKSADDQDQVLLFGDGSIHTIEYKPLRIDEIKPATDGVK